MHSFILSCESTVDMPFSYVQERGIPVLFYAYMMNGAEHEDNMGRDPEALKAFYRDLNAGHFSQTSQINEFRYIEFFDSLLQKGDLLHVAFGSGMTASAQNAYLAADEMRKKYPERKIIVVDSLCSSSGYGLLVDYAADLRDAGRSMEETEKWLLENRQKVHHQFFSTDLTHYRRSGRMSGAAAMLGAILNICPIMRLDDAGRIIAYDKVRGKKNAIRETIRTMEAHAQDGANYSGKCFICHSQCPAEAEETRDAVCAHFPNLAGNVRNFDIGTIIAGHCGPGTVAVFFLGDERTPDDSMKK